MEKELLELLESEINFHGECSSQMIEELLLFFKDREDTAIYIPSTGLYGYMRVKEYLSFFANLTNHRNLLEPAIEFMHLSDIGTMKLSQCTESQKVRVLIARLILLDCHTVFMIEPLRDLEEEAMRMVVSWMANEIEHGKRIISVSPSLKEVCLCPGHHYYLSETGIRLVDQEEPSDDEEGDSLLLNKLSVKSEGNIFLFNPETIIKISNLSKRFNETVALDNCSFTIEKGEVFGYLGPSGAGKTTTIKLLSGQLHSDHGEIEVLGKSPFDDTIKGKIGIMSDNSGLYEKATVYENLKLFAEIYRLPAERIDQVLHDVDLYEAKKKLVENLSKGMKQRLIFARTILHAPELLFLDEPTANLDPSTAEEVRDLIRKMKENGTTVFLTTHNMEEADEMCDRIALLNEGHIIECGSPYELKLKYAKKQVQVTTNLGKKSLALDKTALIDHLQRCEDIIMIHSIEPSLKEVFLTLTEEGR